MSTLAPLGCAAELPKVARAPEAETPAIGAPAPGAPADAGEGPARGSVGPSPVAPGAPAPSAGSAAKAKEVAPDKAAAEDRGELVIYTGLLALQVDQAAFPRTIDAAVDAVVAMGGYLDKQTNESVQVKVPSARFRDAMRELEKLGDVKNRSVEAQDVTEEVHDLDVRLKSLQATRKRFEDFLQRASNIAEVLQVEEQLGRVNGEIDRIEGRLRFLQARAAMSTITVSLVPKPKEQPLVKVDAPPAPPPRTLALPIEWLAAMGIDRLLDLTN